LPVADVDQTPLSEPIDNRQAAAKKFLQKGLWSPALEVFRELETDAKGQSEITLGIGTCLYELGRYPEALRYAVDAAKLTSDCWRAHHLTALCLRKCGRLPEALKLLAILCRRFPDVSEIRLDYGDYVCKVLGDWKLAETIWRPLQRDPTKNTEHETRLSWFGIKQRIYDGDIDAQTLTRRITEFSAAQLQLERADDVPGKNPPKPRRRLRIGLISTFFRATPVYYLCFSALQHLSAEFDLVFYARETIEDWATDKFKSIAVDWQLVNHLTPERLASHLRAEKLDVLIDMSGWLDQHALKALSTRPAKRLFKWVGGQPSTTGLQCFDGFISDQYQSPPDFQPFYTEPLICLESGYVTYTPPPYLPPPGPAVESSRWQVGIISHPMKVSTPFLNYLQHQVASFDDQTDGLITLKFIGWRYGQPLLQKQILRFFQPVFSKASRWLAIEFIVTGSHEEFLQKVSQLDWVIDTFPYTSGLTALEILALGVPCRTRAGTLCSQRHAYSHLRYAGLSPADFDLDQLGPFAPPMFRKSGQTLLPEDCARMNHARLASSIAGILS